MAHGDSGVRSLRPAAPDALGQLLAAEFRDVVYHGIPCFGGLPLGRPGLRDERRALSSPSLDVPKVNVPRCARLVVSLPMD